MSFRDRTDWTNSRRWSQGRTDAAASDVVSRSSRKSSLFSSESSRYGSSGRQPTGSSSSNRESLLAEDRSFKSNFRSSYRADDETSSKLDRSSRIYASNTDNVDTSCRKRDIVTSKFDRFKKEQQVSSSFNVTQRKIINVASAHDSSYSNEKDTHSKFDKSYAKRNTVSSRSASFDQDEQSALVDREKYIAKKDDFTNVKQESGDHSDLRPHRHASFPGSPHVGKSYTELEMLYSDKKHTAYDQDTTQDDHR